MKTVSKIKTLKLSISNIISMAEITLSIVSILFTAFTLTTKPLNNTASNKQHIYGYNYEIGPDDTDLNDSDVNDLLYTEEYL